MSIYLVGLGSFRRPVRVVRVAALAVCLVSTCATRAAETNEIDQLKFQLRELRQNFERVEQEHRRQLEELNRKIEDLTKQQAAEAEKKRLESELAAELAKPSAPPANQPALAVPTPAPPGGPLFVQSGKAYMDIGLVATFAAGSSTASDVEGGTQLGGHDPNQRGFTVQGVEANFAGAVDPYVRGNANVVFQLNSAGESGIELEEAWLETFSLPANLQLRAGQIITEFGRLNPTHPHTWAFADSPLVLARLLGPDGLRNPGARLSWLAPTPFYSELFLSVQDSQGETASSFRTTPAFQSAGGGPKVPFGFRYSENDRGVQHIQDMLFAPRYAASVDLTDNQVLLAGASAAFGPNASGDAGGGDTRTEIYGLDLTWRWKSPRAQAGFPFLSFQTEGLVRRYDVGAFDWDLNHNGISDAGEVINLNTGLPAKLREETLTDYGFYAQFNYGFWKGWVAGLRFDYVTADKGDYESLPLTLNSERLGRDAYRASRWRLSPNLTWYPSEFSKVRLQYNLDDRRDIGVDHSLWLQFEFLIGAHAAHKF